MSHWIKPAGHTYVPSAIVSVVPHTTEKMVPGKRRKSVLQFSHVCAFASTRRKGKWKSPDYVRFANQDDFWVWLESWADTRRKTYIFTPCASNTLTLLGFWELIDAIGAKYFNRHDEGASGIPLAPCNRSPSPSEVCPDHLRDSPANRQGDVYHFTSLILTGNTDIIRYKRKGKAYQWASGKQYFEAPESELAAALGYKWSSTIFGEREQTGQSHNARDRAELWMLVMQNLFQWWEDMDGGPWGATVGQLSYTMFRRSMPKRTVLRHSDTLATALEESALFGGRASLFHLAPVGNVDTWKDRYGETPPIPSYPPISGILTHIDVRSMYPSILATERFPVRLVDYLENVPLETLSDLLRDYGVIAKVRLNCDIAEFPFRTDDRVLFPTGHYTTALSGPELIYALEKGQIAECTAAAVYLLGYPTKTAALRMIESRLQARYNEDLAFELFCKHLANSLSGKLAQKRYGWKASPDTIAETDWGQWIQYDSGTHTSKVYRAIAGMVQERIVPANTQRNMASIYVYLTGYGRQLMRRVRQVCEPSLVLSQDTDGLWILSPENDPAPLERIGKAVAPYSVRQNKCGQDAVFLSPSHHWVDGHWTLAGFQIVEVASEHLRVMTGRTENHITRGAVSPPGVVYYHREMRNLSCHEKYRTISANGTIVPPIIMQE